MVDDAYVSQLHYLQDTEVRKFRRRNLALSSHSNLRYHHMKRVHVVLGSQRPLRGFSLRDGPAYFLLPFRCQLEAPLCYST